jgi:hypothetical protein
MTAGRTAAYLMALAEIAACELFLLKVIHQDDAPRTIRTSLRMEWGAYMDSRQTGILIRGVEWITS